MSPRIVTFNIIDLSLPSRIVSGVQQTFMGMLVRAVTSALSPDIQKMGRATNSASAGSRMAQSPGSPA